MLPITMEMAITIKAMDIVHMIPVATDMGIYYEVHAETAKGIDVFNSFGWHWK